MGPRKVFQKLGIASRTERARIELSGNKAIRATFDR
jgi:hypothetical protein